MGHSLIAVVIAFLLCSIFVAPAGAQQPVAGGRTLVLAPRVLRDKTVDLDALTLLAPADWTDEPTFLWRPTAGQFVTFAGTLSDPKTKRVIRWIPLDQFHCLPATYQAAMQQGIPPVSGGLELTPVVLSAADYITQIAGPRYRAIEGVRVVGVEPLPKLAEAAGRLPPDVQQAYQAAGMTVQFQAARARLVYTLPDNTEMEEDVYCVLQISWSEQANAQARNMNNPGGQSFLFYPERLYSFAAPKGELDRATPLLQGIAGTLRPTAKWSTLVNTIQQMRQRAVINDGVIAAAARAEMSAQQQATYEARIASEDRIAAGVGDVLSSTQRFDSPAENKEVTLPAGFRRAFADGQGRYIVSDDLNYNPTADPNLPGNWTELQGKK